ncbi:MAG: hypothetical protein WCE68_06630 [Anaerolineales bacterium]
MKGNHSTARRLSLIALAVALLAATKNWKIILFARNDLMKMKDLC